MVTSSYLEKGPPAFARCPLLAAQPQRAWPRRGQARSSRREARQERPRRLTRTPAEAKRWPRGRGMHRQGFDLQLTQYDERGWRATLYTTGMGARHFGR